MAGLLVKSLTLLVFASCIQLLHAALPSCGNERVLVSEPYSYRQPNQREQFKWPSSDSKTVYFSNRAGQLLRSLDGGMNWQNQESYMNVSSGDSLIIHVTSNPDKIYFVSYSQLWKTSDNGNTYSHVNLRGLYGITKVDSFEPHALNSDWALLRAHAGNGTQPLFVTKNFGSTWQKIADNVLDADWAPADVWGTAKSPVKNSTILYTQGSTPYDASLYSTADFGLTKLRLGAHIFKIWVSNKGQIAFLTQRKDDTSSDCNLLVTHDAGATLKTVKFPSDPNIDKLSQNSFDVLDVATASDFILLQVVHSTEGSDEWADIYASNSDATEFSLVLKGAVKNNVTEIVGLGSTIYVANVYDYVPVDANSSVHSIITFNRGGSWHLLNATNAGVPCDGPCHIAVYQGSKNTAVDSLFYAPGIGIANGAITIDSQHVNNAVYLTRDAGFTWQFIQSGINAFAFGNDGNILMFAITDTPTNTLTYTWDQGVKNRITCQFTQDEPFMVTDIVSLGYGASSQQFIVYGQGNGDTGYIVTLDFSQFHQRQCTGFDHPGSVDSDYEHWSPSDQVGCILGKRITYVRRKPESDCFSNVNLTVASISYCACSRSDYECDLCYQDDGTGNCVLIPNCSPVPACTHGYRKIAGDQCDHNNGLNLVPGCSHSAVWVIIVLTFAIIMVGGATAAYFFHPGFREWVGATKDRMLTVVKKASTPARRDRVEYSLVSNSDMEDDEAPPEDEAA